MQILYNEDDVFAIGRYCDKMILKANAQEAITLGNNSEIHPLKGAGSFR
jgi:hypothetical protein